MIFERLNTGAENARTAKELCNALDLKPAELRQLIMQERRAGKPIAATCDSSKPGYFIPASREEMRRFCNSLQHRAGEIFKTRAACLLAMEALPDPPEPEENGAKQ